MINAPLNKTTEKPDKNHMYSKKTIVENKACLAIKTKIRAGIFGDKHSQFNSLGGATTHHWNAYHY